MWPKIKLKIITNILTDSGVRWPKLVCHSREWKCVQNRLKDNYARNFEFLKTIKQRLCNWKMQFIKLRTHYMDLNSRLDTAKAQMRKLKDTSMNTS